jgi:hypothetical protein
MFRAAIDAFHSNVAIDHCIPWLAEFFLSFSTAPWSEAIASIPSWYN